MRHRGLLLFTSNLLIPVSVILFIVGFFQGQPGASAPSKREPELSGGGAVASKPAPFNKVIFMMIDALRSDFVYAEGTGFNYTQSLIRSGDAMPFTARATSPTLTLSRIKALTQGTSQSFLDIWLNVFESESARRQAGADTWLSRLKGQGGPEQKLVFYGADIWLDLYPDIFDRHEGTNAWYLPEFDTVDSNVTRHLPAELQKDDWRVLVLHYLGLDNLAHQGGPASSHMRSKQAEMDNVVRFIHGEIERNPQLHHTLFVLLGDHGMTEQGNHGGASPGEVASAMTFISPHFKSVSKGLTSPLRASPNYEYYSVINQVDFVPTLAGLLGFSVPDKSIGVFVLEILQFLVRHHGPEYATELLFQNARQLARLLSVEEPRDGHRAAAEGKLASLWRHATTERKRWESSKERDGDELLPATRKAQKLLNVPPNKPNFLWLSISIAVLVLLMRLNLEGLGWSGTARRNGTQIFLAVTLLNAVSVFKNRLVVEEHHYWYWVSLAWLSYLGSKRMLTGGPWPRAVYPVALQFLSQSIHQTSGTQHRVVEYFHHIFFQYPVLFWIPVAATYLSAIKTVSRYLGLSPLFSLAAASSLGVAAGIFRLSSSYRLNPELMSFAPAWSKELLTNVDRNYALSLFWTGLTACLVLLLLQRKFLGGMSSKAVLGGIVELANFYLRSQARPEHLVLYETNLGTRNFLFRILST